MHAYAHNFYECVANYFSLQDFMYFHVNISLAMSNKYVIFYVNSVLIFTILMEEQP